MNMESNEILSLVNLLIDCKAYSFAYKLVVISYVLIVGHLKKIVLLF